MTRFTQGASDGPKSYATTLRFKDLWTTLSLLSASPPRNETRLPGEDFRHVFVEDVRSLESSARSWSPVALHARGEDEVGDLALVFQDTAGAALCGSGGQGI